MNNPTWKPPIPVGDDVLKCRFCEYTTPMLYRNQSDKPTVEPRDGNTRLKDHVDYAHPQEAWNMRRRRFA